MSSTTQQCHTCGEAASKSCTQCHRVSYCDQSCQRLDWKEHKKVCFPDGAECARCLKTISSDNFWRCTVPHPVHMLQDAGCTFGPNGCSSSFSCSACGEFFTRSSTDRNAYEDMNNMPITKGPKFCYFGPHTTKPLKANDERRICNDTLVLVVGPNLQKQIKEIPEKMPNIRILTIQSTGCYETDYTPELEVSMPNLECLKLIDVAFSKIKLDTNLTPSIEELFMQNIPDDCNLTVLLPELKSFSMHYYGPADDEEWIHKMLLTATKLETFDSYKLRVGPTLNFAGNHLRSIRLHRAEVLNNLSLYAPKLQRLDLQACYDFYGEFRVLESHPKFAAPPGQPSTFSVNTENACISPLISQTLQNNPRIIWDGEDGEDDYW